MAKNKQSDWLIPEHILEEAFEMLGLTYVSNNKIPADLIEKGWMSRTYQNKKVGGENSFINPVPEDPRGPGYKSIIVELVHAVFGPNEAGESRVRRSEHVAVRYEEIDDGVGQRTKRIVEVMHNEDAAKNNDPCLELFNSYPK
jgi:hypothetical protein